MKLRLTLRNFGTTPVKAGDIKVQVKPQNPGAVYLPEPVLTSQNVLNPQSYATGRDLMEMQVRSDAAGQSIGVVIVVSYQNRICDEFPLELSANTV